VEEGTKASVAASQVAANAIKALETISSQNSEGDKEEWNALVASSQNEQQMDTDWSHGHLFRATPKSTPNKKRAAVSTPTSTPNKKRARLLLLCLHP
jgi:hypothetical protein